MFDIKISGAKCESETAANLDAAMKAYVEKRESGATGGWSVRDHAALVHGEAVEICDSFTGEQGEPERNFRLFILFRLTANYSAFRQKYEKSGVLTAGQRATGESLAAEYLKGR